MTLPESPDSDDDRSDADVAGNNSRWQFSLQSLFAVVGLCAILLGLARMSPLLAYVLVGLCLTLVTRGVRPLRLAVPLVFAFLGFWLFWFPGDWPHDIQEWIGLIAGAGIILGLLSAGFAAIVNLVLTAILNDD